MSQGGNDKGAAGGAAQPTVPQPSQSSIEYEVERADVIYALKKALANRLSEDAEYMGRIEANRRAKEDSLRGLTELTEEQIRKMTIKDGVFDRQNPDCAMWFNSKTETNVEEDERHLLGRILLKTPLSRYFDVPADHLPVLFFCYKQNKNVTQLNDSDNTPNKYKSEAKWKVAKDSSELTMMRLAKVLIHTSPELNPDDRYDRLCPIWRNLVRMVWLHTLQSLFLARFYWGSTLEDFLIEREKFYKQFLNAAFYSFELLTRMAVRPKPTFLKDFNLSEPVDPWGIRTPLNSSEISEPVEEGNQSMLVRMDVKPDQEAWTSLSEEEVTPLDTRHPKRNPTQRILQDTQEAVDAKLSLVLAKYPAEMREEVRKLVGAEFALQSQTVPQQSWKRKTEEDHKDFTRRAPSAGPEGHFGEPQQERKETGNLSTDFRSDRPIPEHKFFQFYSPEEQTRPRPAPPASEQGSGLSWQPGPSRPIPPAFTQTPYQPFDQLTSLKQKFNLEEDLDAPGTSRTSGGNWATKVTRSADGTVTEEPFFVKGPENMYSTVPDIKIPYFYGNSLEFYKWWQMFRVMIDQNERLPKIMKLNLLQRSLKGPAYQLVQGLTFGPGSYDLLKKRLVSMFDSSQATIRALTERARNYKRLTSQKYMELSSFHGFAADHVMQLVRCNNGANFNPRTTQMELFSKLTPALMQEYQRDLKAEIGRYKRPLTDSEELEWMLDWLEEQVKLAKLFEEASPDATAPQLGIGADGLVSFNKKKRRGDDRRDNRRPQSSTDAFATVALATTTKRTEPTKKTDNNCVFCEGGHVSRNCRTTMEVDTRLEKAFKARLCLWCLESGHRRKDCVKGKPCGKQDCKESHHTLLHGHRGFNRRKKAEQ